MRGLLVPFTIMAAIALVWGAAAVACYRASLGGDAMSEQTLSEKYERALRALREIADAEPGAFSNLDPAMATELERAGVSPAELAFKALQNRAHVCLMAIDPSYAG